jgi:hypothetical protein
MLARLGWQKPIVGVGGQPCHKFEIFWFRSLPFKMPNRTALDLFLNQKGEEAVYQNDQMTCKFFTHVKTSGAKLAIINGHNSLRPKNRPLVLAKFVL